MSRPDGGPAFPFSFEDCEGHARFRQSFGVTVRDYFAAKALVSLHIEVWHWREDMSGFEEYAANTAKTAYGIADAMLSERSKP